MPAIRAGLAALLSSSIAFSALSAQVAGRAAADSQPVRSTILRPARVFDGVTAEPRTGWVVLVTRRQDRRRWPRGRRSRAGWRDHCRSARHDAAARADRRPLAPPAAPVQRDVVGRPGAARSRSRCASRARRTTRAPRCSPDSRRCATSAPRARATPTSGSSSAIEQGIIPGPRMLVATRAIVATGSYGPKGFARRTWTCRRAPRKRTARRADARRARSDRPRRRLDQGLRRLPLGAERRRRAPTFTLEELTHIVEIGAQQRPRRSSRTRAPPEGMRRAVLAGVETIEHGDDGTPEVFR